MIHQQATGWSLSGLHHTVPTEVTELRSSSARCLFPALAKNCKTKLATIPKKKIKVKEPHPYSMKMFVTDSYDNFVWTETEEYVSVNDENDDDDNVSAGGDGTHRDALLQDVAPPRLASQGNTGLWLADRHNTDSWLVQLSGCLCLVSALLCVVVTVTTTVVHMNRYHITLIWSYTSENKNCLSLYFHHVEKCIKQHQLKFF